MWPINIVLLICLLAGPALSNPPAPAPSKASDQPETNPKKHKKTTTTDQRGTESSPVYIKVVPSLSVEPQTPKETDEHRDDKSSEWWLVYITGTLVAATIGLMIYTGKLWGATKAMAEDAKQTATRQAAEMKESLRIAEEAANASVVTAMPVLSPLIVGGTLHPSRSTAEILYPTDQPITFESKVHFIFENFGKTPGMIREVRGELFLCEMDQFPQIDFGQLPIINYLPIVAGDSRGDKAMLAVGEYEKTITLTQTEFEAPPAVKPLLCK